MPEETIITHFASHEIKVVYSIYQGGHLYIDGKLTDQCSDCVPAPHSASLKTEIEFKGDKRRIEVFIDVALSIDIRICLDGRTIAGNQYFRNYQLPG